MRNSDNRLHVLDTDHITIFYHSNEAAMRLRTRLTTVNRESVVVTNVSFEEQVRGRLAEVAKAKITEEQRVSAYRLLDSLRFIYFNIRVLPFDAAASDIYTDLKHQFSQRGTQDLKIAAIVLANDGILLSRNLRDFQNLPNLLVEDWTI